MGKSRLVPDPWQELGLEPKMVDNMIEICNDKGLETVYAFMLPDNHRAIRLLKKMGFTIKHTQDVAKATLNLKDWKTELRVYGLAFLGQKLKSMLEEV